MRGARFWCIVAAAVALFETAGIAIQSRVIAQARDPIGIAWLIVVDDLHIDFRNTGYLRNLLKSIASELFRPADVVAVRSTGPSRLSIDLTSDRNPLEAAIGQASGSALKLSEILATPARDRTQRIDEIAYRLKTSLDAASALISEGSQAGNRPKGLLYLSNGYSGEVSTQLTELARAARRANVTIFAIDPRGVPGSPLAGERSSATQASLRAIVEPSRGFAVLDEKDFPDAMTRIRRTMLAAGR